MLLSLVKQLEQNIKNIKDTVDSLTLKGQNRLMEMKTANMLSSPTINQIEEDYKEIVYEIYHLNKSIKFLKKSIKYLNKTI